MKKIKPIIAWALTYMGRIVQNNDDSFMVFSKEHPSSVIPTAKNFDFIQVEIRPIQSKQNKGEIAHSQSEETK